MAGKYELETQLGQGGMGTVWRAHHQDLGEDVALKVLNADVAQSDEAQKRFLREVKTTTSFVHPYAVQLRDFGRDRQLKCLYFTMDLVEGRTLEDVLKSEGTLELGRAVRLISQVLEVLEQAHEADIVHRDLKPANLILTTNRKGEEEVRVLDFGIAKAMSSAGANTTGLTLTGTTIGTLAYMSPEQVRGKKLDARSDLYSLAVVLYQALAGRLPIEPEEDAEDTRQNLSYQIVNAEPTPLGGVDPGIAAVVMAGLAKDKDQRPLNARAMREALAGMGVTSGGVGSTLSGHPTGSGPAATPEHTDSFQTTRPRPSLETDSFQATRQAPKQRELEPSDPVESPRLGSVALIAGGLLVVAMGAAVALDVGGLRQSLTGNSEAEDETGDQKSTQPNEVADRDSEKTDAQPKSEKTESSELLPRANSELAKLEPLIRRENERSKSLRKDLEEARQRVKSLYESSKEDKRRLARAVGEFKEIQDSLRRIEARRNDYEEAADDLEGLIRRIRRRLSLSSTLKAAVRQELERSLTAIEAEIAAIGTRTYEKKTEEPEVVDVGDLDDLLNDDDDDDPTPKTWSAIVSGLDDPKRKIPEGERERYFQRALSYLQKQLGALEKIEASLTARIVTLKKRIERTEQEAEIARRLVRKNVSEYKSQLQDDPNRGSLLITVSRGTRKELDKEEAKRLVRQRAREFEQVYSQERRDRMAELSSALQAREVRCSEAILRCKGKIRHLEDHQGTDPRDTLMEMNRDVERIERELQELDTPVPVGESKTSTPKTDEERLERELQKLE